MCPLSLKRLGNHKSRELHPGRQGRVHETPGLQLHAMALEVNDGKSSGKSTCQGLETSSQKAKMQT